MQIANISLKTLLRYALIFILGGLFTYSVLNFKALNSGSAEDYAGNVGLLKKPLPTAPSSSLAGRLEASACSATNCDVIREIDRLHDEIDRSSWTLETVNANLSDKFNWILDNVNFNIARLHDQVGRSSWTLDTVHGDLSNKLDAINIIINRECGSGGE